MIRGDRVLLTTLPAERGVFVKRPRRVQDFSVSDKRWLKEESCLRRRLAVPRRRSGALPKTDGISAAIWGRAVAVTRGIAEARGTQSGKAVRLERTLPGEELLLR